MSSLDSLKESTEKAVSFVEWLAEVLRGKNWVTKLLLLDVVLLAFLNPASPLTLLKFFLAEPELPGWYRWVFWLVIGLIFLAALIVAYRTLPRKAQAAAVPAEHKAIKGLRPFGLEDAEVFARLQREASLRECLATVTDRDFRFGILCGESGCGKTSFLQAGLWPTLLKQNHQCVYVKFTELDPLDSVRQALAEKFQLRPEQLAGEDLPALLAIVAPVGSPPLALLFDQFEQFFVHRQRKEERQAFVQALADWYQGRPASQAKILLCLRDDFYGRLIELQRAMGYSLGPQQSLRLEKFTPREAAAIFRVIAETEALLCDENFVQELTERELASLEDGLISAVDLQILAWMIRGQRSAEERAFNRTAFQKLGGLEGLLERFLARALQVRETEARRQATLKVLLALTDLERNARAGVLSAEEVEKKLAGTVAPAEVREALEWLARGDVRLATPIEREGARGYELAHERLIPALRRLAGKELSAADQANQILDHRVNEWLGNQRANRYLLTWREWRLIQQQRPHLIWGPNRNQKEALLAHTRRYWRRLGGAAALVMLLLVLSTVWWHSTPGQISHVKRELERLSLGRISDDALRQVAVARYKAGDFEQARRTSERIGRPWEKARVLGIFAEAAVKLGDPAKVAELFEEIRGMAEGFDDPRDKVWALANLAKAAAKIGDPAKAAALYEEARRAAEGVRPRDKAWALSTLAEAATKLGDPAKVAALIEHVRQTADRIDAPGYKGQALGILAEAAAKLGDPASAAVLFEQIRQTTDAIGDPEQEAVALGALAEAAAKIGDRAKAVALIRQIRKTTERIDAPGAKANVLSGLAERVAKLDDPANAFALYEQARQTAEKIGDPGDKARLLRSLDVQVAALKFMTMGVAFFEQVRQTVEELPDPEEKTRELIALAEGMMSLGRVTNIDYFAKATALYEQAHKTAETIGDPAAKAWALRDLAEAQLGDPARAAVLIEHALQTADGIGDRVDKVETLGTLAEVVVRIGDSAKAAALKEQIRQAAGDLGDLSRHPALGALRDQTWFSRDRDPVEMHARAGDWRRARAWAALATTDDGRAMALAKILEVWAEQRFPALAQVGEEKE